MNDIMFTIMDKDLFTKDDFMAQYVLPKENVPQGISGDFALTVNPQFVTPGMKEPQITLMVRSADPSAVHLPVPAAGSGASGRVASPVPSKGYPSGANASIRMTPKSSGVDVSSIRARFESGKDGNQGKEDKQIFDEAPKSSVSDLRKMWSSKGKDEVKDDSNARRAQEEQERQAQEAAEEERKRQAEAERLAREEEERRVRAAAEAEEQKRRAEEERIAREEEERRAREEEQRREEAERRRRTEEAKLEKQRQQQRELLQQQKERERREAAEAEERRRRAEVEQRRCEEIEAAEAERHRREKEAEAARLQREKELRQREIEAAEAKAAAAEAEARRQEAEAEARRRAAREEEDLRREREEAETRRREAEGVAQSEEKEGNELVSALMGLRRRYKEDSQGLATCLQTLRTYINNLARNPHEVKFQRINCENAAFKNRVAAYEGATAVLGACGFEKDGTSLVVGEAFLKSKGPALFDAVAKLDVLIDQLKR
mmetsp:Transcript_109650/g.189714  ORF Transcript_109650/g.189714 Transcript_109650/m.189714 type:complete len:490 (+) Transcript_109650:3-1472(+)